MGYKVDIAGLLNNMFGTGARIEAAVLTERTGEVIGPETWNKEFSDWEFIRVRPKPPE